MVQKNYQALPNINLKKNLNERFSTHLKKKNINDFCPKTLIFFLLKIMRKKAFF